MTDATIDAWMRPLADAVSGFIFVSVPLWGAELPLIGGLAGRRRGFVHGLAGLPLRPLWSSCMPFHRAPSLLALAAATTLAVACAAPPAPPPAADVIFRGPHILTMDPARPAAEAVAVRGETIVAVGNAREVERHQGPATRTVELGERALLPGLIDAHGHLSFTAATLGMANVAAPPVGPVRDLSELADTLRAFVRERQPGPGAWVVGLGYDDSLLAEGRHPTRDDLDAVSDARPILLFHVSGHLASVNSAALAAVGIGPDTPDPPGGVIRRGPDGRTPTGVLEESATWAVRQAMPPPDPAEAAAGLLEGLQLYAAHGITTVQDGALPREAVVGLAELAAQVPLPLDVVAYWMPDSPEAPLALPLEAGRYHHRLKLGGIKLMLDGSPQGKTAWLSRPYHEPPPGQDADYRGYPIHPVATVEAWVARILDARIPLIAHANGDAAAEALVDAVEAAAAPHDHRTVMIHAQTVRDDQLDRMAGLGMLPSFFAAHTFYWGDWHRDSVLGPERAARISPTRSARDRGLHFTVHNDAPVVPPDMLRLLWASVNRRTRSDRVLGAEQALTVEEALHAMTLDAAYQYFEEDTKGSLTPGKQADLVVLSADPRTYPVAELDGLQVLETFSRGRSVYRRAGEAPPAAP